MTKFQKQMMTIAAIGALSAVTALPAMAADVNFYGSARLATFYNFTDVAAGSTSGFDEHLQSNSRFGANFKNGDFGGKFEVGTGVNLRLLYGTWNFGSGKLTVGQDYNRYYTFVNQVARSDNGLNGFGSLWDTRQAQIRVDMNNGFYFSAIQPTGVVVDGNPDTTVSNTGKELYLPKVNVGYAGKSGNFTYNVGVVGQTYNDKVLDEQITSLLGYVNGAASFGDTKLMYNLSYGQNPAEMGFNGRYARTLATDDITGFEGYLQLTQKLSDTLSANVGVGYVNDKGDGNAKDDKFAAYVNMPVKLAKYVTIVPEFYYQDELKKDGADQDSKFYAVGAKWQLDF